MLNCISLSQDWIQNLCMNIRRWTENVKVNTSYTVIMTIFLMIKLFKWQLFLAALEASEAAVGWSTALFQIVVFQQLLDEFPCTYIHVPNNFSDPDSSSIIRSTFKCVQCFGLWPQPGVLKVQPNGGLRKHFVWPKKMKWNALYFNHLDYRHSFGLFWKIKLNLTLVHDVV